ncbi:substrate-binding domain-containing protein [Glaciibacter psychrotolerans]|uniref:Simple sugar transport system substrate-binding protein n=1 Tax=Glaciibacter psychrotolerans TaxID=670054 RepID=A0A7Z0EFW5_9MICO|nr:simple sugar transport system substrate-binding protein [Leifsonia psychrotolerans]
MKFTAIPLVAVAASMLLLTACSQAAAPAATEPQAPVVSENDFALPDAAPAGFKKGLKIALVRQSGVGDYFEQWGGGFTKQVTAAGGTVNLFDARGDNGQQVTQFSEAINSKPDAIVVDHGLADSLNPKIDEAIEAGIPVVVYDVAISNQDALYISQDDESLAGKILDQIKVENPDGGSVAYVNVSGIAPLDTRDGVYKSFLTDNPTYKEVAHFGKYSESAAADTATEGAAALSSAPETTIVFAAYDELAKGALIALRQNNMLDTVNLYGVDISTADIGLMTEAGSPWKATAATDPANVGAIVARASIAAAAGVDLPSKMAIPAALITQKLLLDKNVTNMDELRKALPELSTPGILGASWITEISIG